MHWRVASEEHMTCLKVQLPLCPEFPCLKRPPECCSRIHSRIDRSLFLEVESPEEEEEDIKTSFDESKRRTEL